MPPERASELIRLERIYPVDHPAKGHVARRINRTNGGMELALFAPDGREVVDLEVVKRAFSEIASHSIEPTFREESWVAERRGLRCLVVRTIDADGRREIVSITTLNGESEGPSIVPDPPMRSLWARVIEATSPG